MYYGFLESIESAIEPPQIDGPDAEYWPQILSIRRERSLQDPVEEVWLDCISASYFNSLDWVHEPFDSESEHERHIRRQRISELDRGEMIAILLLLGRQPEEAVFREVLARNSWHGIHVSTEQGIPALSGPDFDIVYGGGEILSVENIVEIDDEITAALNSVFNVDFLEELDFDEDDFGEPGIILPPLPPLDDSKVDLSVHEQLKTPKAPNGNRQASAELTDPYLNESES